MKSWDDEDDGSIEGINITPLVDTALVLLLVFMVATPVIMNQAIKVKLPKVSNSKAAMVTTVALTMKKDGSIYINGQGTTYKDLRGQLTGLVSEAKKVASLKKRGGKGKVQAIIAADKDVAHGKVMHLVDVIKDMGIEEFAFNIEKVSSVPGP
jgi:biopolymer transport protein ExbD